MSHHIKNYYFYSVTGSENGQGRTLSFHVEADDRMNSWGRYNQGFTALSGLNELGYWLTQFPDIIKISLYLHPVAIGNIKPEEIVGNIIRLISEYGHKIRSVQIMSGYLLDEHLDYFNQSLFPNLWKLALPRCSQLGHQGIKSIVTQCQKIIALDLHYTLYRKDAANKVAHAIGENLHDLIFLNMHRTLSVLDDGLRAIVEGCVKLEFLNIGRNSFLTDDALMYIAENCTNLEYLGMYYNSRVTDKGFKYLLNKCKKLKCFHHGGWGTIVSVKNIETDYPQICFKGNKHFCLRHSKKMYFF